MKLRRWKSEPVAERDERLGGQATHSRKILYLNRPAERMRRDSEEAQRQLLHPLCFVCLFVWLRQTRHVFFFFGHFEFILFARLFSFRFFFMFGCCCVHVLSCIRIHAVAKCAHIKICAHQHVVRCISLWSDAHDNRLNAAREHVKY